MEVEVFAQSAFKIKKSMPPALTIIIAVAVALEISVVAIGIENQKVTAPSLTIVVAAVANSVEREESN
jgi:hypothetical protein